MDNKLSKIGYWSHQIEAITLCENYIKNYENIVDIKSCLVNLPTGSGKSGIISYLCRISETKRNVLVLTPRKALRYQLANDINGAFFSVIKQDIDPNQRIIIEIDKGNKINNLYIDNYSNYIMTMQLFSAKSKENNESFQKLMNKISLIIIDEGHYEPAVEWGKEIRKANKSTILFTATPYRNDFRYFEFDSKFIYFKTLKSLAGDKISEVEFDEFNFVKDDLNGFVSFVVQKLEKYREENKNPEIKAIIKCSSFENIKILTNKLKDYDQKVFGIHERALESDFLSKDVPTKLEKDIYIHQYKLLEGVDYKEFKLLFIYDEIGSARALVQQVGRIIRRNEKFNSKAIVYCCKDSKAKLQWNNFLEYEDQIKNNTSLLDKSYEHVFYEKMQKVNLNKIVYLKNNFRKSFIQNGIEPLEDIGTLRRVNVYQKEEKFNFGIILEKLEKYFKSIGYIYYPYDLNLQNEDKIVNIKVYLLINIKNSPPLINHIHLEWHMTSYVICEFEKRLYTSEGHSIFSILGKKNDKIISRIKYDDICKIICAETENVRINQISLINTNPSSEVPSSKTLNARSINELLPRFDDYSHIYTQLRSTGWNKNKKMFESYYIGVHTGKISYQSESMVAMNKFVDWIKSVEWKFTLNSKVNILNQYAIQSSTPNQSEAIHILFEFEDEIDRDFKLIENEYLIENNKFTFQLQFNKSGSIYNVNAEIFYDKGKYDIRIACKGTSIPRHFEDYIDKLNAEQNFRVIPKDYNCVYYRGIFYNPQFKIGKEFTPENYPLANCIYGISEFSKISNEKGDFNKKSTSFSNDSLFGLIANLGSIDNNPTELSKHFGAPKIMVCDDMGYEIADFVVASKDKVVFIHAKAKSENSQCSASGIQEVCGQAIKNLGFLSSYNKKTPPGAKEWLGKWNKTDINRNIITPNMKTGIEIWDNIKKVIDNPHSDKEVWLVLKGLISRKYLTEKILKVDNPDSIVIHALYILNGVMSVASSMGIKFRVFCDE